MNGSRTFVEAAADYAVLTDGLTKRYGDAAALSGVDFRVPAGSVCALLGANGAGKSTALRLLMNLERPDAGVARVFGMDCGDHGPRVRAQIGYVPENPAVGHRWMTCGRLIAHLGAYYPAWDHAYAAHLCDVLGVAPARRVGTLSKGETRRLQLVLALAHRPALLLLDEPTDGLDPIARKRALALLAEHLADSPTTVVISTHQISEVETLVDLVAVLCSGRLTAQVPRDELLRTVRRYDIDAPEGWTPPADLQMAGTRHTVLLRGARWTLRGDETYVIERIMLDGASVRDVTCLPLEDAALALLPGEVPR